MDEKAWVRPGQCGALRNETKTKRDVGKRTHRLKASAEGRSRFGLFSNLRHHGRSSLTKSGRPLVKQDETDGNKASALDVYLRFKLSPLPLPPPRRASLFSLPATRSRRRTKFCRPLIFLLASLILRRSSFSTKEDREVGVLLYV